MAVPSKKPTPMCKADLERVLRCRGCGGVFYNDYDAHNHDQGRYVVTPKEYGRRMAQEALASLRPKQPEVDSSQQKSKER